MADQTIIDEIRNALDSIKYGSVEVIVQDGEVTQISTRIIKKTKQVTKPVRKITGSVIKKGSESGINVNFKY
jgi:hypothetical protein